MPRRIGAWQAEGLRYGRVDMALDAEDVLIDLLSRMLVELTPAERLALLDDAGTAVNQTRGYQFHDQLPPDLARQRDRNELRILRRTRDAIRRRKSKK
jgi:hypothetical protein